MPFGLGITTEGDSSDHKPDAEVQPGAEAKLDVQHPAQKQSAPTQPEQTQPEREITSPIDASAQGSARSTTTIGLFAGAEKEREPIVGRWSSFSIAAAVIAALLILTAAAAVVTVATNFSRRPSPPIASSAREEAQPQPEVTVPTPAEALDYSEPAQIVEASQPGIAKQPQVQLEPAPPRRISSEAWSPKRHDDLFRQPVIRSQPNPQVLPKPGPRIASAVGSLQSELISHLLGVEAERTSAGVHYELTFSLANESGRQSFLRNLTIVTRSSRGTSRTQNLPFSHRLGPNGRLTFKIGVDLPGRNPDDLRGHVSLLASGYDSVGDAVQTRFAAPLNP